MLKFLPEAVRKACTRDSPLRELPFIESDAEGAAAVIDISGFTILTTNLLKLHGADGAAKLRDAIDGVFDVIIRTIYRWGGSIVKFAGDAALASWSSTPDSGQLHLVKAYLCCLELLREFRDNCSALNEDIGIHIGLASGAVHHIHLGGSAANDRGTSQNRREYLIAGQAVIEAARLLDLGHRGDLLMSIEMKKCLEEVFVVPPWPSLFPRPKVVSNQWVYLLKEDDTQIPDILRSWSGIPFPELPNYQEEELDENFALTYIETSVRKHLFDNHGLHSLMVPPSSTTLTQESTCRSANYITAPPSRLSSTKVSSETYSDMRSVSIAFFRFPDVHFDGDPEFDKEWSQSLGTISESQEEGSSTRGSIRYSSVHRCLHHAQHIVEVLMRSVTSQGGTVRQINYDDKAFTILAVWGLRGLAHHRAETRYTLAACMEVARKLTGQGFGSAQIGVSTGTVYTGLFGNELRMDGTVLGAPVNLAARLMCLDGVAVGLLRKIGEISIFCDDSTQLSGSEWFSFMEAPIPAKLKGFSEALMVYLVVGEKSSSEQSENIQVVGRTEELKLLKDTISSWRMKSQRHTLFITGRSGFGKSTLIKTAMQMLDRYAKTLFCTCVGDEMKQRTSLGVLDKLVRGLLHKMRSVNLEAINFKQIRARQTDAGSRAGSHLWSRVGSRGGSRLSLIQQDRDWSYLNDILEALCVSKAGIATIAAIPGLRKIDNSDFVPSDGEISVRLSIVLATLINGLYSIGYSVCLVWDDIQWFDRETLKTLLALIQYCPHALFLIVGRTRNEWDRLEDFDQVRSQSEYLMELRPLDIADVREMVAANLEDARVSEAIIGQIMDQTNGVPIALRMILNTIKANRIGPRTRSISSSIIFSTSGAIVAQLDLLSVEFRFLLSVASVIGQHFELNDLAQTLQLLDGPKFETYPDDLLNLMESADRFGFLTRQPGDTLSFSFSHCMIQQGVLATLLPQQREAIHHAIVRHYQKRLEQEPDDGKLLPSTIEHILKISGETALKCSLLYQGFVQAATYRKEAEAFYCRNNLLALDPQYFDRLSLMDQMTSCRILANMHYQTGNSKEVVSVSLSLLARLGKMFTVDYQNSLKFIKSWLYHRKFLGKLTQARPHEVRLLCFDYLSRTFPVAFPQRHSRIPRDNRKRVANSNSITWISLDTLVGQSCHPGEGQRRLTELALILDLLVHLFFEGRLKGLNYLVFQMASILVLRAGGDSAEEAAAWNWHLKLGYTRLSLFANAMRSPKSSKRFQEIADSFSEETVTLRDLACKGYTRVVEVLKAMFSGAPIGEGAIRAMKEAIDDFEASGLEFDDYTKAMVVSMHTLLSVNGVFHLPEEFGDFDIQRYIVLYEKFVMDRRTLISVKICHALELSIARRLEEAQQIILEYTDMALESTPIRKTPEEITSQPIPTLSGLTKLIRSLFIILEQFGDSKERELLIVEMELRAEEIRCCYSRIPSIGVAAAVLSTFFIATSITNLALFLRASHLRPISDAWDPCHAFRLTTLIRSLHNILTKSCSRAVKTDQVKFCKKLLEACRHILYDFRIDRFLRRLLKNGLPGEDIFSKYMLLVLRARVCRAKSMATNGNGGWREEAAILKTELLMYNDESEVWLLEQLCNERFV